MNLLTKAGIFVVEVMFVAGWIGSVLVITLAGLEDVFTMFRRGKGEEEE